ncbi:MAG: LysR family transcriptional regulator [Pseudomonadota bacterium]
MSTLHNLHAFCAVAAAGSVRGAGEKLHRAFSAVARSIAGLETTLDVLLFERKGRGMLMTPAGATVKVRADRIEQLLYAVYDDALRLSRRASAAPPGNVNALFSEHCLTAAVLLAESHNMPTVARAMGITQPAVSQALARLEQALGCPLFLRNAQGMMPTDSGARWTVQFGRVLAELRHIEADVTAISGYLKGLVTVGALPLSRTLLLPRAVTALLARHPGLQVRSIESPFEELCAGLLDGRVDFIVGALREVTGPGLSSEELFVDETVLIARASHPLNTADPLTLSDIAQYPWVLSRAGTPLRDSLELFFGGHGRRAPQPAVETGDLALLRGLLLQEDFLTVLSAQQLHFELNSGELTVLPFPMEGMQRAIGLLTRKGAQHSPGAEALLAEIRKACTHAGR